MGFIAIILFSIFVRNVGVYGIVNVRKEFVKSFFPQNTNVQSFDPVYYEKKLLATGIFSTVRVRSIGRDTIDVIVALKERKRYSASFISSITPDNKIATGIQCLDRFLFKNYEMKIKWMFYNITSFEANFRDFTLLWGPTIKAKISEIKGPFGRKTLISEMLIGVSNKDFNIFIGPRITKNKEDRVALLFDFSTVINMSKGKVRARLTAEENPEKFIISTEVKSSKIFFMKHFIIKSESYIFLRAGDVPSYKKVIIGGYKTMMSYPFLRDIGQNGYFLRILVEYPLIPQLGQSMGLSLLGFVEVGKVLKKLEIYGKFRKGIGIAMAVKSETNGSIGYFISYNGDGHYITGLYFH